MKTQRFSVGSLAWLFLLGATLFLACHLDQGEKTENTLSFTKHYETLSQFDDVSIAVVDPSTGDTTFLFRGKVDVRGEIEKLDVPGWDGGPIIIVVSGFKAGSAVPVFVEEKKYDGRSRTTDSILVLVSPNPGITATSLTLQLSEGQILPLPQVTIAPDNLADSGIVWSSDRPEVAAIRDGALEAVSPGTAQITARLHYDASKSVAISVTVQADPTAPNSLALDRDTLFLAQHGAPGAFIIDVKPATAKAEVTWTLSDSSIAGLRADGSFQGLLPGLTRAIAASKSRPGLRDTAYIRVSEPVLVQAVRFVTAPVTLYIGGTPQTLEVEVLPAKANQDVLFSLTDSTKANLNGTTLGPRQVGTLSVIVRSKENPSKSDTLQVTIKQPVQVQSVAASADTLTLYVRGPGRTLTAQVLPDSAPQGLRWVSLTPGVASVNALTGQVEPGTPGLALVVAASQADSSRKDTVQVSVKLDIPHLTAGPDTAVSAGQTVLFHPTATQEYGQVVMFKWDLDGDQSWDDSATALKDVSHLYAQAKVYRARLFVRDTEGNEVTVYRLVTVVSSAAVTIEEPKDNTYTNKRTVPVVWYVNNVKQESQATADLVPGPNEIVRTAKDSAGKAFTVKVTVHLDTAAPQKPNLTGTSPTNTKPKWSWSTGGGGGSGDFRFKLGGDGNPAEGGTDTRLFEHALTSATSDSTYTLYIQERDAVGNWSAISSLPVKYDLTKPTVTITAPLASGTYITKNANMGMTVTASGQNAISKVTFTAGASGPADATPAGGSTWTIPAASIPLVNQEIVEVTVTAIDVLNNTGSAQLSFLRDSNSPSAPTGLSVATSPTNSTKGSWIWSQGNDGPNGSGLSGNYRYNFGGSLWTTINTPSVSDLNLVEGSNTFYVQEQDNADNWSAAASNTVIVDTKAPDAVTFSGTDGSYTDTQTPTWTWSPSSTNGGIGTYVVKLDSDPEFDYNSTTFLSTKTLSDNETHTLTVRQRDQVAGVVGAAKSFSYKVKVHPAGAPMVKSDANVPNNGQTNNPKFTWVSGVGGNGIYRVRLNNDAGFQTHPQPGGNQTSWSVPSSSADGTYTIRVSEQDQLGRWGSEGTFTIQLDRTGPTLTNILVKGGGYPLRENFITNKPSITVTYNVGSTAMEKVCTFSSNNSSNDCVLTGSDALGNTTTLTRHIWWRKDVRFFSPTGGGNGSSWEEASSDFYGLATDAAWAGKEVWMSSGDYRPKFINGVFDPSYGISLIGGFNISDFPVDDLNRSKTNTHVGSLTLYFNESVTLDGLVIHEDLFIGRSGTKTLRDCKLEGDPSIYVNYLGTLQAFNLKIENQTFNENGVYNPSLFNIYDGTVILDGGSITGNTSTLEVPVFNVGGNLTIKGGMNLYGNTSNYPSGATISIYSGVLTIEPGVNFDCRFIEKSGGSVNCNP